MSFLGYATMALLCMASLSCIVSDPSQSGYLEGVAAGTSGNPKNQSHRPPAVRDDISYWDGDGVEGPALIRINRKQQKALFYKGNQLVAVSRISSGTEGHDTPAGRFKITEKDQDHKSSLYGVFKDSLTNETINGDVDIRVDEVPEGAYFVAAPMPNFMRFTGAIGMHTGYLPGYAASHGCIRMPHHMSEKFFANVKIGTPVIVE